MVHAIALVDLDDTLFQTRRKCPADVSEVDLTVMAYDREGQPASFATPRQLAWIEWLRRGTVLVPVTGRSVDALRRVDLAFDHAIAAHGGVVLRPGGLVCPVWQNRIGQAAEAVRGDLEALTAGFDRQAQAAGADVRVRIIAEADTPLYVVAKHRDPAREEELHALAELVRPAVPSGWTVHVNGNNVAYLPPHLGKRQAVEHLLGELRAAHPALPVIGLGDSVTDAPFLALCDFAMIPGQSQLAERAFQGLLA
ncbi:hypothetical protein [Novosphingobium sp.]|uniref:hypothetical protein n=1 Tax=Novosphingobium sp. TaxID=1874826 RepID=UPI0025E5AB58|nr:hypothetical protein [Novosphingobium sp.]MCC6926709.1 hypothetical protein [Novosphingobium sp.]